MNNYCAFSNNHQCLKWTDYQVTRYELEEADELCQCNQLELFNQFDTDWITEIIVTNIGFIDYQAKGITFF